jgi:hypothetical protein
VTDTQIAHLKHRATQNMNQVWPHLEVALLEAGRAPGFTKFLANYRGLAEPLTADFSPDVVGAWRAQTAESLLAPVRALFAAPELAAAVPELDDAALAELLTHCEETLNLALYYWHGPTDRNYQFRTVVHFFDLEGLGDEIIPGIGARAVVSLSEAGFRFGNANDSHLPRTRPVAAAFGLHSASITDNRAALAKLRTIARELCLLLDEWEHRNALLAVEFTHTREAARKQGTREAQLRMEQSHERMAEMRDSLATWCMESFILVQEWLNRLRASPTLNDDLIAEIQAAEAVMLSGLQKVFLPASVSRHLYCTTMMRATHRWCELWLETHGDDLATRLLRASLVQAIDPAELDPTIERFLEQRSFEWIMAYDPCTPLKAFCWSIGESYHRFLSSLTTIAVARKRHPAKLDSFWFVNVGTLADMPSTFTPQLVAARRPAEESFASPPAERLNSLVEQACAILGEAELDEESRVQVEPLQNILRGLLKEMPS